jgi:hypothetical protein
MASVIMAVTYGNIPHRDGDPVLDRAHELADIVTRVITPQKAALFAAFPFRGCLSVVYDINLNAQHVGYSRKVTNMVL